MVGWWGGGVRLCNLLKEIPTEEKLLKKMAQEDSWWEKK